MHLPQLGHPSLKHLIVPGPLHFRTRLLPQILATALASFLIRKIIIRPVFLLRISMTGARGLSKNMYCLTTEPIRIPRGLTSWFFKCPRILQSWLILWRQRLILSIPNSYILNYFINTKFNHQKRKCQAFFCKLQFSSQHIVFKRYYQPTSYGRISIFKLEEK